ncbi:MAG: hypothetical protein PSV13_03915 [Lacunisphaera sp.]|nr:hypothetical protein [Lacunisphaera sp.]
MKELNILELTVIDGGYIGPDGEPDRDYSADFLAAMDAAGKQATADLWAEWTRLYGQNQQ